MKKTMLFIIFFTVMTAVSAQEFVQSTLSDDALKSFRETKPELIPGVFKDGMNIYVSDETKRLLSNADYRKSVYPLEYKFEDLPYLLETGKNQLVLYYIINLFEDNPVFCLNIVSELIEAEISGQAYTSAFQTYVYADPEIADFSSGRMQVMYPDILEKKMKIANYLAFSSDKLKESYGSN